MKKRFTLLSIFVLGILGSMDSNAQVPNYVRTSGLAAWYSFNGNTNDGSSNANHLTSFATTAATDRFGTSNSARALSGNNEYLKTTNALVPSGSTVGNFAVSLWFKGYNPGYLGSYGEGFSRTFAVWSSTSAGPRIIGYDWDSSGGQSSSNIPYANAPTDWHHVVYVRNGLGSKVLYIDGVRTSGTSGGSNLNLDENFYLGCAPDLTDYYQGNIDDVALWIGNDDVFTDCDAMKLYKAYAYTAPQNQSVALGGNATFSVGNSTDVDFQWQVNSGTGWQNLSNAAQYSGVTSGILTVSNVNASNNNYVYRCIVDYGGTACTATTAEATLTVTCITPIAAPSINGALNVTSGGTYVYTASGQPIYSYDWTVVGGIITSGAGTVSIGGEWGTEGQGSVSLVLADASGCQSAPATVNVTVEPSGIFDHAKAEQLAVFPNPSNGQFYLDFTDTDFSADAMVNVFDNTGKVVFSSKANTLRMNIDIESSSDGIYLIQVIQEGLLGTARIQKVN